MIVFVHGVPETSAIWSKLRSHLNGESVALSMPGFGCPRPAGFGATKDEYVTWLVDALTAISEPVDLVGHDWGAGLTYRVATAHGELLHSWCADVAGIMHPTYAWHDFARIWQTPGEGETFFSDLQTSPLADRGAVYEMFGVQHDDALEMAAAVDETMAACILDLYRSATPNPFAHWGGGFKPTSAPGMVLHPSEDPFDDEATSLEVASILGAGHERLEGLGHFWPLQGPQESATVINRFIDSVN
jgi:pimeloyl-ACP methyl ester carboxylesterase